eukprot:UN31890
MQYSNSTAALQQYQQTTQIQSRSVNQPPGVPQVPVHPNQQLQAKNMKNGANMMNKFQMDSLTQSAMFGRQQQQQLCGLVGHEIKQENIKQLNQRTNDWARKTKQLYDDRQDFPWNPRTMSKAAPPPPGPPPTKPPPYAQNNRNNPIWKNNKPHIDTKSDPTNNKKTNPKYMNNSTTKIPNHLDQRNNPNKGNTSDSSINEQSNSNNGNISSSSSGKHNDWLTTTFANTPSPSMSPEEETPNRDEMPNLMLNGSSKKQKENK